MGDGPIPAIDGREALGELLRTPAPLLHRLSLMGNPYRPIPVDEHSERVTAADVDAAARQLGFRLLGRFDMTGLVPLVFRPKRERYVDPLGFVCLSTRHAEPPGPIEARMSRYFLVTYFDDGSWTITWSKREPPIRGVPFERGGTGDLATDYESHLESVRAETQTGKKALILPDLATALGLAYFVQSRTRPADGCKLWLMRLTVVGLILFGLVCAARR